MAVRGPTAKVEFSMKEVILAIGFVFLTILAVALVQVGYITNPMTLGLMITMVIGLIFLGHFLMVKGVISRQAVPLWYIFAFGLVMILYGLIRGGTLAPAFVIPHASVEEIAISNALFYALVVLAVIGAIASVYVGFKTYQKYRGG